MADKLIYILNVNTQNYNCWLKRLDTQLNKPTKQNPLKVPKVVKPQRIRKRYYKTLKTSVINSPLSNLSMPYCIFSYLIYINIFFPH